MVMPEQIPDGFQWEPALHEMRRQRMTEHMRSMMHGVHLGPVEHLPHKRIHQAAFSQGDRLAVMPHEDFARTGLWTVVSKIRDQRLLDRGGQREHERAARLGPSHPQHPGPPVDVIDTQVDDLARTEAVDGEQQEHRVVATADGGVLIGRGQQATHVIEADRRRQRREPIPPRNLYKPRPVLTGASGPMEMPQHASHDLDQPGLRPPSHRARERPREVNVATTTANSRARLRSWPPRHIWRDAP